MKEITKEQFKEIYLKLGGGAVTGWGVEYWKKFYEDEKRPGWKYLIEGPETPDYTRMVIVEDYGKKESRLFFLAEEGEESFFDFPDKGR